MIMGFAPREARLRWMRVRSMGISLLDQIAHDGRVSSFYVVGVVCSFASTGRLHIYSIGGWIPTHPYGLLLISFAP
jgi:hypothetical protein